MFKMHFNTQGLYKVCKQYKSMREAMELAPNAINFVNSISQDLRQLCDKNKYDGIDITYRVKIMLKGIAIVKHWILR